ncbi:MAG: glycosyltransferase [Phycisphaerales bacterium]|nr:glycosyltransferase [Phycisphaerales bacterium]
MSAIPIGKCSSVVSDPGVISDRLIVCLASSWDIDPTCKHHLMRLLSARNEIVWVNYHASRRPNLSRGDLRSAAGVLRRIARGTRPIQEHMVQTTPLVLPGAAGGFRDAINRLLLISQLRRIIKRRRRSPDQPVQLWTYAPDSAFLAGALGEEALVYYCVDEFSEFEGFDREATLRAEDELLSKADLVITTSQRLFAARRERHPRAYLVRHGVDHAHFAKAVDRKLPRPETLRGIRGPIIGFIGLVQHWFDAKLMERVARRMRDASFVIVGDCRIDVSRLKRLPNVHFTGRQPYDSLPAYCSAFDVGLIPFVRTSMTDNVNPIKLREYLAAGLPVVSTSLPEVRPYAPDVAAIDGVDGFVQACRNALAVSEVAQRRARSERMTTESWEAVTARVSKLVNEAVQAHQTNGK